MSLPSVEEQREQLRQSTFEAPKLHRVVFVGRFFQGSTGIVASLHRALEGLGHTVLPIDPARHKEAFDNSSGATGGYGPIFFRPEELSVLLDRFRPEIIIFCAGGVVLDESGSRYLKDRKIMSIGVTLSDPDVQDSVIDWVENFDFHTTNAELSLQRYLKAGLQNTLLMPFGIDKEYVLRRVDSAPELKADAICIGHATGRPERHEVMGELAEHVNVKVYGTGWNLPAETVAGDRLLQAAHAGTFHVNFPQTRAGFTNVKCGVFETVGVGSILCTLPFDEMGQLFDYDTEILGYTDGADLARQIRELKSDPERMEQMRRRSFHRLVTEHLYEHRWLTLFHQINSLLEENLPALAHDERERLRRTLGQTHKRPRHVIVSGFYGASNRGDDMLLEAIAEGLHRHDPDTSVIVAGVNAKAVERLNGYQAFSRADPHEAEKFAANATALILGGGGLWHDYTIARAGGVSGIVTGATVSPAHLAQLPIMTRAYGGQFHVFGMGVGPLNDEAARAAVRLTGSIADSITVRDQASLEMLEPLATAWESKPSYAPDAVYGLALRPAEPAAGLPADYIVLNVRDWDADKPAASRIRELIIAEADRRGLGVVALPMQPVDMKALAPDDGRAARYAAVIDSTTPIGEVLHVIEHARAVVSMRLHSNLLAHRLGRPAVGFAYDPKVREHFSELGRESFVLDLSADDAQVIDALDRALLEGRLPEEAGARVRELESKARTALDELAQAVVAAPAQVSPIAGMVHMPPPSKTGDARTRSRSIDESTIWTPEETIDLRRASIRSGNANDPVRVVASIRTRNTRGDRFQLDSRAPKAGDFVVWSYPVEFLDREGVRLELWIKQQYGEKPSVAGFMAYSVLVDGIELFEQDITAWSPRNTVWVGLKATHPLRTVEVRLRALRDCPDWNWGPATPILIERGRLIPWQPTQELVWGASSPSSLPVQLVPGASVSSAAEVPPSGEPAAPHERLEEARAPRPSAVGSGRRWDLIRPVARAVIPIQLRRWIYRNLRQ